MEETVVVLRGVALVIAGGLGRAVFLILRIGVVEGRGGERARLDGGAESGLAHIAA